MTHNDLRRRQNIILLAALVAVSAAIMCVLPAQADNFGTSTNAFVTPTGTQTLSNKTIASPVFSGSATGVYTLAGTPTITGPAISAPVFSGSATGVYTLAGTPTLTSPTITTPAINGAVTTSGLTLPAFAAGGDISLTGGALTSGTMTRTNSALERSVWHRFDWTNAMVVALGASASGDITICTLPANTLVKRVFVVIDTQATGPATLTMSVGYTSATYVDYLIAASVKAVANTLYGGVSGDLGTKLTGYDVPSVTGTTALKAHFIATVATLDGSVGSTGHIYVETVLLP